MSFFDPLPEPPPPEPVAAAEPEPYVRPEWYGPPEAVIGGLVPVRGPLHVDDRLCLFVDRIVVYPIGLIVSLELFLAQENLGRHVVSPGFPWALVDRDEAQGPWGPRLHDLSMAIAPENYLRFGLRLIDGRTVVSGTWSDHEALLDRIGEKGPEEGELVMMGHGGSGGQRYFHHEFWLWPVSDSGPIELVVAWPALDIPETTLIIAAEALATGRAGITELWPSNNEER